MNFIETFTTSREAAEKAVFDALDRRAINLLSNLQKEDVQIDEAGVDGQYHEKNPKIDLFHNGAYVASTNWSKTVKHAVDTIKTKKPELTGDWSGKKATNESVDESLIDEEFVVLEEGVRKLTEFSQGRHRATVHKDSDLDEYQVKFHTDGKHLPDADYFSDDKADAEGTAKAQIIHLHNKDHEKVSEGVPSVHDDEGMVGVVHTYSVGQKSDKDFKMGKLFKHGENKYTANFYAGGKRIPKSNKDFTDRHDAIKHIKATVNATR